MRGSSGSGLISLGRDMAKRSTGWHREFDERIALPDGRRSVVLRDAASYITALPKQEVDAPEWQAAIEALMLVVELGGPTMIARIGFMARRAPCASQPAPSGSLSRPTSLTQFSLAKLSFEISQPGARQLFSIILSRLPPLLQMSLKQASSFIRPMNLVVRGSVYTPSRVDSLPQQVLIRHSQPLRSRDRIRQSICS